MSIEQPGFDDGPFLSQDLRRRLVRAVEHSAREAAARLEVSPSSAAIKLLRRLRETEQHCTGKIGGYRELMLSGHEDLLRELTATRKGITLAEIQRELIARGSSRAL